jgi:hypothetical protein
LVLKTEPEDLLWAEPEIKGCSLQAMIEVAGCSLQEMTEAEDYSKQETELEGYSSQEVVLEDCLPLMGVALEDHFLWLR